MLSPASPITVSLPLPRSTFWLPAPASGYMLTRLSPPPAITVPVPAPPLNANPPVPATTIWLFDAPPSKVTRAEASIAAVA